VLEYRRVVSFDLLNHALVCLRNQNLTAVFTATARAEKERHSLGTNPESMDANAAALIIESLHIPRYRLSQEFNTEFNINNDFGDLVLHYAQIGKTWWEVFLSDLKQS
jgi:hypothetical protein